MINSDNQRKTGKRSKMFYTLHKGMHGNERNKSNTVF